MKKNYIEPQMKVVKIKAANMLCGSVMKVNIMAPDEVDTPDELQEYFGAGDAW